MDWAFTALLVAEFSALFTFEPMICKAYSRKLLPSTAACHPLLAHDAMGVSLKSKYLTTYLLAYSEIQLFTIPCIMSSCFCLFVISVEFDNR